MPCFVYCRLTRLPLDFTIDQHHHRFQDVLHYIHTHIHTGHLGPMGILDRIRVLELSDGWTAATLAGRLLAELGAQVHKFEPPGGDSLRQRGPFHSNGMSYAFTLASAMKHSVCVATDAQADTLHQLAPSHDVLLLDAEMLLTLHAQGMRLDDLTEHQPHLVVCAISPHGLQAPEHLWGWSELALQASTGLIATTGFPDAPPTRPGVPIVTHGTAIGATLAILAALYERRQSGRGQCIDLAGYDVAVAFLGTFLPTYFRQGLSPGRDGNRHPLAVPWNAYPTRDGWAIICSMGDTAWLRLLEAIGRDDLKADERFLTALQRSVYVDEVDEVLSDWTRQHDTEVASAHLLQAGVPIGPILPVHQFLDDAYCHDRQLRVEAPQPAGPPAPTLGPLFKLSASPGQVSRGAPAIGDVDLDGLLAAANWEQAGLPERDALMGKPLAGVRVIEMAAYTAAPYGTRLLALLGAEVIKVEPLKGDPMRHLATRLVDEQPDSYVFHLYNTDKKSVSLNTAAPDGRDLLRQLIGTAQVFVHNLSYDLIERLTLTYEDLRQSQPGLVYAVASGFGQQGAWRERRAFDTILQAFGGVMAVTGRADQPPVRAGISVIDLFGALMTAASVAAAVHHQRETGEGQLVDVALGDVSAWLGCETWPLVFAGGEVPRVGNRHWFMAPHNVYQTQDRDIVIAVDRDAQWQALLGVMGQGGSLAAERFATVEARLRAVDEVDALVQNWLAGQKSADVVSQCQRAGVPASVVMEIGEAAEAAMASSRQVIMPYNGHLMLDSPFRFSRSPVRMASLAPAIGQHNGEVGRGLLGLTEAEMQRFRADGVMG